MCFIEAEHHKAKHKEHAADTMHQTHVRNSRGQEELNMTQTTEKDGYSHQSLFFLGEVKSPTNCKTIIKNSNQYLVHWKSKKMLHNIF